MRNVEMPFGMHKGKPVDQVPESYLRWAWRETKPKGGLKREIARVLGIELAAKQSFVSGSGVMYWEPPYNGRKPTWGDGFDDVVAGEQCPF